MIVGVFVGAGDGKDDGTCVGNTERDTVGSKVDFIEGTIDGFAVGLEEG